MPVHERLHILIMKSSETRKQTLCLFAQTILGSVFQYQSAAFYSSKCSLQFYQHFVYEYTFRRDFIWITVPVLSPLSLPSAGDAGSKTVTQKQSTGCLGQNFISSGISSHLSVPCREIQASAVACQQPPTSILCLTDIQSTLNNPLQPFCLNKLFGSVRSSKNQWLIEDRNELLSHVI